MKKIILTMLAVLLAGSALGATGDYSIYKSASHPDYDSVHYSRYVVAAGVQTFVDSGGITANTPDSVLLTFNEDSTYLINWDWFPTGVVIGRRTVEPIGRWPEMNSASLTGDGDNSWTIAVKDTTDGVTPVVLLDYAKLTIRSIAGTVLYVQDTEGDGKKSFNVAADSFTVQVSKGGTSFLHVPGAGTSHTKDTIVVSGDPQTDTVYGFMNITLPPAPLQDNVCATWGYVSDFLQGQRQYATITFTLAAPAFNVCDSSTLVMDSYETQSDDSGYYSANLVWSSCLQNADGNAVEYKVTIKYQEAGTRSASFAIPDSASYRIWMD
ncbi:MAG TPA: hypothetical protein VFI02_14210 [Armatimonadota bacterium]|nr:hypothetical protein [Armatimonadota bacterium]